MRTYGAIRTAQTIYGQRFCLEEMEPHVIIRLKQLFPRIPKTAAQPFVLPMDDTHAADLDWFMQRYPLRISEEDRARVTSGRVGFERHQADMERILLPDWEPPEYLGLRPGQSIRRYQAQAVETLVRSGGLLLGDDVGLGKTFTAAAACLQPGALPAAVVCQPHLQRQWCRVIEEFTTLRAHAVKKTKPYDLPKADVYVFRYTQLAGWCDMFEPIGFKSAIYDEIQELRRGYQSDKGMAASRLSGTAARRLGLSATPIYNYGNEIFNLMQFLKPGVLGDFGDFCREWCPNGHVADPKALGTYLREQRAFLRRTKSDIGQQLPRVDRIVDEVACDEKAMATIEERARSLALRATTGVFTERGQAARELDLLVRQQTGVSKAVAVADVARMLVEGGEPVVLVGWHREVYGIWLERLKDLMPVMFTGSETAATKAANVAAFVNGETNLMFMSLRSGAGLDGLQKRCSTMVFGELDWSPGVHAQCIGRLDREGQTEPVTGLFLVCNEGSDPPMMEMLGLKASQAGQIVDPHLGVQIVESDTTRLRLLVDRYLNKRERREVMA